MSFERKPTTQAEDHTIYRDAADGGSGSVGAANSAVNAALSQAGSGTEHASGATFHNDAASHAAASALNANAFTAGSDVYFGAGQFSPGTAKGDSLISHELTHVEQAKGTSAPEPGNFKVSSPGDSAEVEARAGGHGTTASDNTIYRDGDGTPGTTGQHAPSGGAHPASPATPAHGDGATPAADPYDAWKAAINAFNRPDSITKWASVPQASKAKLAAEDDSFQFRAVYVMKKDSVPVMKDSGMDITKRTYQIFLADDFDQWLVPLRTAGLLNAFLDAAPKRNNVGLDQQHKLGTWVAASTDLAEIKHIFNKLYPPTVDSATISGASAIPWTLQSLKKLYAALGMVPVGHAQMVSQWVLQNGGGGWWEPDTFRVVLPSTTGAVEGSSDWTSHRMTGGSGGSVDSKGKETNSQQVSPNYKDKDGKDKTPGAASHNEMTIVHEVGHAVGQRLDGGKGNAYALNAANFPKWTKVNAAQWCNDLWENGHTGSGAEPAVPAPAKLDDAHAKAFISALVQGTAYSPGGSPAPTQADMLKYCKWRYADVPLMKWQQALSGGLTKDPSYRWGEESARVKGDWVYGYYTRWDDSYAKHSKAAWDQKVSWYSLSSPLEWFAEQYTHFYRTEKTGSGMDSKTSDLMKELDKLEFAPTTGTEGVTITNLTGSDSPSGGQGAAQSSDRSGTSGAGASGGAAAAAPPRQPERRPLFFDW